MQPDRFEFVEDPTVANQSGSGAKLSADAYRAPGTTHGAKNTFEGINGIVNKEHLGKALLTRLDQTGDVAGKYLLVPDASVSDVQKYADTAVKDVQKKLSERYDNLELETVINLRNVGSVTYAETTIAKPRAQPSLKVSPMHPATEVVGPEELVDEHGATTAPEVTTKEQDDHKAARKISGAISRELFPDSPEARREAFRAAMYMQGDPNYKAPDELIHLTNEHVEAIARALFSAEGKAIDINDSTSTGQTGAAHEQEVDQVVAVVQNSVDGDAFHNSDSDADYSDSTIDNSNSDTAFQEPDSSTYHGAVNWPNDPVRDSSAMTALDHHEHIVNSVLPDATADSNDEQHDRLIQAHLAILYWERLSLNSTTSDVPGTNLLTSLELLNLSRRYLQFTRESVESFTLNPPKPGEGS